MALGTQVSYIASYDYVAKADGELSLTEGDELYTQETEKEGWIQVRSYILFFLFSVIHV